MRQRGYPFTIGDVLCLHGCWQLCVRGCGAMFPGKYVVLGHLSCLGPASAQCAPVALGILEGKGG